MKKLLLFSLCTIAFLAFAQCSPHNGLLATASANTLLDNAAIEDDCPSVIPLDLMAFNIPAIQEYRFWTEPLRISVNSTLFYRNFGSNLAVPKDIVPKYYLVFQFV